MNLTMQRSLLLLAIGASAEHALAQDAKVKNVFVAPKGNEVRVEVELTQPVNPTIRVTANPAQLIIEFPDAPFAYSEYLMVDKNGVSDLSAGLNPANRHNTRIIVGIDSARPYAINSTGNRFELSILPHPGATVNSSAELPLPVANTAKVNPHSPTFARRLTSNQPHPTTSALLPRPLTSNQPHPATSALLPRPLTSNQPQPTSALLTRPLTSNQPHPTTSALLPRPLTSNQPHPTTSALLPRPLTSIQPHPTTSALLPRPLTSNKPHPTTSALLPRPLTSNQPHPTTSARLPRPLTSNQPHPTTSALLPRPLTSNQPDPSPLAQLRALASHRADLQVTHETLDSMIEDPETPSPVTPRTNFNVKYIAGNTVYIDGGTNSGLRTGMILDIHPKQSASANADQGNGPNALAASVRVVGVAATSAITEVVDTDRTIHVGDPAELDPQDAVTAAHDARDVAQGTVSNLRLPTEDFSHSSSSTTGNVVSNSFVSSRKTEEETGPRMAGRISLDYSSITSTGSTPGTTAQRGISFQSDMTHILGSHWNLQGYWRGRINQHSQFQEPTIEESLNKTYTMQLYYDNPNSKWVGGVGRLYLPWATSLDTIDGGYVGHKWPLGMTTGIFAGSTPDLNSWHYRPNQRIGGSFVNFEGGDYQRFHFTSTTGFGVNTLGWKVDRPFAFFENEASYKGVVSIYHSLIADTLRGVSTNGERLPPGVSHSYFTAHYMPNRIVSLDLYHNYFRDVPTATTTIVGTGLVDKLLFQGLSAGVHLKPIRNIALYTTLGASNKTGDSHRSLNMMFGGSWSEIAHTGVRADFHYSKFDSNFGSGNYQVFSLSRQVTNRAFWNVQVGKQNLLSNYTTNHNSIYVSDSLDVNVGRRSYLQSGYTYVNGATMNYRQLYFSWGFRFNRGKGPEFVESRGPVH